MIWRRADWLTILAGLFAVAAFLALGLLTPVAPGG